MTVEENVQLGQFTTYGIGGHARYFVRAENADDVKQALVFAKENQVPYIVLGGGSNVVISDKGYDGLVIHMVNASIDFQGNTVYVDAGVSWDKLVSAAIERGLGGIEWGAGIPGQVGGAIRGNAGAFGGELKDVIESVEAVVAGSAHQVFSNKECDFAYRTSVFKEKGGMILSAKLRLVPANKQALKAKAKELRDWRKEKHP